MEVILSKDGPVLVEFAARGAGFNVFESSHMLVVTLLVIKLNNA